VKEEERLAEKQFVAMIELEFLLFISHLTIGRGASHRYRKIFEG
jgi:hypothetical protein